jgi:hypothetical protein
MPIYRGRETDTSFVDMLVRFRDIEDRAPLLFSNWLTHADKLFDPRTLYFAGAYGSGFVETRLLALTQSVEAFHRRYRGGEHMPKKQFKAEVLKPMLAAIPEGTNPSFAKRLSIGCDTLMNTHSAIASKHL